MERNKSLTRGCQAAITAVVWFFLFALSPALAHKVNLFAYVENNTVYTEGYFGDGKKVQNGRVEVFDEKGVKLLEGTTDEGGQFVFEPPKRGDLRIVLHASMGHRAECTVSAGDVASPVPADTVQGPGLSPAGTAGGTASTREYPAEGPCACAGPEEIRAIVDEALDARLKPLITAMLESRQSGPSWTEIMGGIGYIFGLFGIALYFASKQKK